MPMALCLRSLGIIEKQSQFIGLPLTFIKVRVFLSRLRGKVVNPLLFNLIPLASGASGCTKSSGNTMILLFCKFKSFSFGIPPNALGQTSLI